MGDLGSIPGLGRSPGKGTSYPLQYSCLENSMDRGAWWATVHRVAKSRTRLSNFHFHSYVKREQVYVSNICSLLNVSCASIRSLSVEFSRSVMSHSFRSHGLRHARLPCPSPTPRAYSNKVEVLQGYKALGCYKVAITSQNKNHQLYRLIQSFGENPTGWIVQSHARKEY